MNEKVLNGKKNGMSVLLLILLVYIIGIAMIILSGISLDEEAANMMVYMSAYNAASRLMTTMDEALNILINNTGLVGR